jgi:carbamoyltransferase
MIILGINGFGQNPAACVVRDGKLESFIAEERLTRLKGSDGIFPSKAAAACLRMSNLRLEQVDRVAFAWNTAKYPWHMFRHFASTALKYRSRERAAYHVTRESSSFFTALDTLLEFAPGRVRAGIRDGLRAGGLHGKIPPIEFVDHHLSHSYSTYFCSPFQKAGILTIDGSGEDQCTQLSLAEGDTIRTVESYPIPHSLGWFYAAITQYLGFLPYRDEGKLMGLAALGEERSASNKWLEPLSKVLVLSATGYEVNPIFTKFGGHFYGDRFTDALVKLLTDVDPDAIPISYGEKVEIGGVAQSKYLLDRYVDIAWAAQELLERAAVMLAQKLTRGYGVENLCLAGGVGLNCKMNGEILRRAGVKNIFVQPASSDDGAAIGAALRVAHTLGDNPRNSFHHAYWGPGFSNDEIRRDLVQCGVKFQEVSDPAETSAELLARGEILGWFQGRMELGARALGGRSILADPVSPDVRERVNRQVKYRESWRPFCPSLIEERKNDYLEDPNEASFMIVAYKGTETTRLRAPAAVHVDGTVRPQVVSSAANPLYHRLISCLGAKTGHPIVLNTSFNIRSEPIVCAPLEALRCYFGCGLDTLVMGNFVIKKS